MASHTHTFRLFKKKLSFTDGIASILDFSGVHERYNIDASEKEADLKSIQADWLAIGKDMKKAIDIYAAAQSE